MANLGTAYVQIVPSAQGISGSISTALGPESSAAGIAAGRGIATNLGTTLSKTGGLMMKAGGIATALAVPLVAGIKKSMDAYGVQAAAETKLTEIYKTRMGVTGEAAQKTIELASALQKQGIIGDEVTLSGAQQLATFAKYPGTVDKLLPAMDNLLAQQKGVNATSQDATNIANMMGKVMMGQTGALKRAGVTFDETQEKIMKTGTEEEKAAMLAEVITQNVGNMNEAFAQTDAGKIQQMKNSMGDLSEKIGGMLAPAISNLASFVSTNLIPRVESFLNFMSANPLFAKIVLGVTGVLAVGGPLLIMIGSVVSAVGAIAGALAGLTAAAAAPIAAVVALVGIFALVYSKSEALRTALSNAASAIMTALAPIIQTVIAKVQEMMPLLSTLATMLGNTLAGAINLLTPIITTVISVVGSYVGPALDLVKSRLETMVAAFQVVGSVVAPIFTKLQGVVAKACSAIGKHLNFSAVAGKVQSVFNSVKAHISFAIEQAKFKVGAVVNAVRKHLDFAGLAGKVKSTFETIKKNITKPIETARNTVKSIINKIKGFFPINVGKIIGNIRTPHFTLNTGEKTFMGKTIKYPTGISVSWHDKAMDNPFMFRGATLFGAGETGDEVLYGKRALMGDITNAVSKVSGVTNPRNVTITNNITVNGAEDPEAFAERFVRSLELQMRTA